MDAKELKKYIYDKDLIETILEKIGCHSFVPYNDEIRCALPDDNDNSKVSISLDEHLNTRVFTSGETIFGSIFDLIMYIDKVEFKEATRKCASLLGLGLNGKNAKKKDDHLDFFKKINKKKQKRKLGQYQEYDLSILDKYSDTPHIDLIKKDSIFGDVLNKYHIKFDERTDRVVFPHFKYNDSNKVIGLIGRTVIPAHKELNIPKYFSMEGIKYEKSKNLYGYSHNVNHYKENGYIVVFEAEKSVLKLDMFGYPNGCSVGCHDISEFQKGLLVSLGVEIVIAFDKGIDEEHIKKLCNELNKYSKTSYIKDKWGLLKEGDSPVDRGYKKWKFLFKHRIKTKE